MRISQQMEENTSRFTRAPLLTVAARHSQKEDSVFSDAQRPGGVKTTECFAFRVVAGRQPTYDELAQKCLVTFEFTQGVSQQHRYEDHKFS